MSSALALSLSLPLSRPVLVALGAALSSLVMLLAWLDARRRRDASWVDVCWAALVAALAVLYAALGPGDPARRALVASLAALWGLRLVSHLARRLRSHRTEDGRYATLRARWGARADRNFFIFFQAQASWSVLFSLPILAAATIPGRLGPLDVAGVAVWLLALAGESLADAQLARFRARPESRGRTCRTGLWAWSRHPNYFFEWLGWFAYVLLAARGPLAWLAWLGPVVMFAFLYKVTGIPYTEAQALRSRGDDYRDYQRTTSAFFPWPP